jgi:hypothetical protein
MRPTVKVASHQSRPSWRIAFRNPAQGGSLIVEQLVLCDRKSKVVALERLTGGDVRLLAVRLDAEAF